MLTQKAILPEKVPFRSVDGTTVGQNCEIYFVESMIVGLNCTFYTSTLGKLAPNPYRMLIILDDLISNCEIYKVDITFFKSNMVSTK